MRNLERDRFEKAKNIFRQHGGILKMSEAVQAGIHRKMLYAMRDAGIIEKLDRGLYRLADLPPLGNPDLVSVAMKVPTGVICLISALSFHEITTQIPHEVYIALRRGTESPRLKHPPVRVFRFTGEAFTEGIETPKVDGIQIRIYNPEKTLADCFKYRNKIGLDIAVEALKLYRERKRVKVNEVMRYARICRVEKVMRPYLEALL
ncbi:MAG: type IV toxin-antitoxin system AbiEi family antitoxin domain-containing protein [Deltaproteobacteria bacterium]|nr:type IV toxin-antitoxin system AbiEi family antitoxin domain-containing protein [Deltaproteobacteria bacterium]